MKDPTTIKVETHTRTLAKRLALERGVPMYAAIHSAVVAACEAAGVIRMGTVAEIKQKGKVRR